MRSLRRRKESGWSGPGSDPAGVTRNARPPERLYEMIFPNKPQCRAWGEDGYEDPDAELSDLEPGTRYWQGFAKNCVAEEAERAMSPGWVASVTSEGNESGEPHGERLSPRRRSQSERRPRFSRRGKLSWFG